ncbi:hypothetical protein cypCar_00042777, partial [Cyprinus carpio]
MKASQETGTEANIEFGRALMPSYLGMRPPKAAFFSFPMQPWYICTGVSNPALDDDMKDEFEMLISNIHSGHTEERPKAKVTIKPDQHVLRGETVTLRCDTYSEGVPGWQYSWYKEGSVSVFSELQEHIFSPVAESDA